jgi:hypothetical protein
MKFTTATILAFVAYAAADAVEYKPEPEYPAKDDPKYPADYPVDPPAYPSKEPEYPTKDDPKYPTTYPGGYDPAYPTTYPGGYDPKYPTTYPGGYDPKYPTTTPCTTSTDYPSYPTYPPKYPGKDYPSKDDDKYPTKDDDKYPHKDDDKYPTKDDDKYPVKYTTKVVDSYTTYCPYPTTFVHDGKDYPVTTAGYYTVTGPVTVSYPVYTKSANGTKPTGTSAYKPIATAGAGKTAAFSGAVLAAVIGAVAFL